VFVEVIELHRLDILVLVEDMLDVNQFTVQLKVFRGRVKSVTAQFVIFNNDSTSIIFDTSKFHLVALST
jgi:hypothetical protein